MSSPYLFDATTDTFDRYVLENSFHKPVLVDFWADWCAPCKALFPVLEKIVDSYQGELLLAKVNCDVEVGLTERFGIRSLPTVVLFKDGQPVEGFAGIQTESAIRELLTPHVAEPQAEEETAPEGDLASQAQALIDDIERFRIQNECDRLVMVWCGSTEAYQEASAVHDTVEAFEAGLRANDENISPSQIYVYAALMSDVPFANGAPNLSVDLPCMIQLAARRGVPIAGKDFKTGQTLIKTMLAPGFKARMLGLSGWYSTNILGNRDGEVLDDPENFKTKEMSKLGVLDAILQPDSYPELYGNIDHVVRINYYPPRGDNKEGWDAIDIFGWMGYPMQIKVNFLCRDSILAAPIVLDLALFLDLAHRAGQSGVQEWLSFYLKAPQAAGEAPAEHDLFIQQTKFKNTLREWMGEQPVTHSEAG